MLVQYSDVDGGSGGSGGSRSYSSILIEQNVGHNCLLSSLDPVLG